MVKNFNAATVILTTTETDVYIASSKTMTLLIQAINLSGTAAACQLWITDASNNHIACLIPQQSMDIYNGTTDTNKHILLSGQKIRGSADPNATIYVELSLVEGV
jgi:hypothetical protein